MAEDAARIAQLEAQLAASSQRETALAEVLRVIASSPTELATALDSIVRSAAQLADADFSTILQAEGDILRVMASLAPDEIRVGAAHPFSRGSVSSTVILDGVTIHEFSPAAEHLAKYPDSQMIAAGYQAQLVVPLIRRGVPIGSLGVARRAQVPFTDRQIALLETFADQAVIAIENSRLFSELEQRNSELQESNRQVTEALEQQTALAEVLRVIAASPTDVQRVLEAIAESAAHVCGTDNVLIRLVDGGHFIRAAGFGVSQGAGGDRLPIDRHTPTGRVILDRRTWAIDDVSAIADEEFPTRAARYRAYSMRSFVIVPMLREGVVIGTLGSLRTEVRPFSEREIALLETFADQAVIAIENARLFEALQEANSQLAEASQHKSDFLANMSHELRTPLNAILSYSQLLREEAEEAGQEETVSDLQKIHGAGQHLLGLINDILDLSKIEAGRMDLYLETFDVATLIHDTLTVVRPLVERNGNALVVNRPDDIGVMHADQSKVRETLLNLLSNAAKFTDHGTVTLAVERESNDWVTFDVSDSGIGMTEEQLGRLFEAFSQAEASTRSQYGGTGSGLAISRHFCRLMGGDLTVTSVAGQGSTFTARVPAEVREPN